MTLPVKKTYVFPKKGKARIEYRPIKEVRENDLPPGLLGVVMFNRKRK